MGQEESVANEESQNYMNMKYKGIVKKKSKAEERIEHEGILKIQELPFRNSIQICSSPPLFMENTNTSLEDLLEERYNTNRLFIEEDIIKLMQTILYTLTYLETKNVIYGDLSIQNIFYDSDSGSFKLLPIELIKETAYQMAFNRKKFSYLSPELIIALRYGERDLQQEILSKSNIFSLGMIMLQVTSLQPSTGCYEKETYDILDSVINQRLQTIREFYPEKIVKFIALMLDYDYTERIGLKELSVEVNKELMQQKIQNQKMINSHIFTQQNIKSRIQEQRKRLPQQRNPYTPVISQNQAQESQHYQLANYDEEGQQVNQNYDHQQNQNEFQENDEHNQQNFKHENTQKIYYPQHQEIYYQKPVQKMQNVPTFSTPYVVPMQHFNQPPTVAQKGVYRFKQNFQQQQKQQPYSPQFHEKHNQNQYQPFVIPQPQLQQEQRFPSNQPYHFKRNSKPPIVSNQNELTNEIQNYTLMKKKNDKGNFSPQINNQINQKPGQQTRSPFKPTNQPTKDQRYSFYSPYKEQEIQQEQKNLAQRLQRNHPSQFRQPDLSDSSISKIKEEIQRSRKLIMEFQRSQNIMEGRFKR